MRTGKIGMLLVVGLALGVLFWGVGGPGSRDGAGRAEAQDKEKEVKKTKQDKGETKKAKQNKGDAKKAAPGRYQIVSGPHTMVMLDTQTGETFGLLPDHSSGEFVWAPIRRLDEEGYKAWIKDRREAWLKQRITTKGPDVTPTKEKEAIPAKEEKTKRPEPEDPPKTTEKKREK